MPSFYCGWHKRRGHEGLFLDQEHKYYHECQMQILCMPEAKFCDFVVWTSMGAAVERIKPDPVWQVENVEKLETFHQEHVKPCVDLQHEVEEDQHDCIE